MQHSTPRSAVAAALSHGADYTTGLGQFKAGRKAIVTDWHNRLGDACAEYCHLAGVEFDAPTDGNHPIAWRASDHDSYWYGLGCLPPALQTAVGFLVGEPYTHRICTVTGRHDVPTFTAFAECGGAYFKAFEPVTRYEFLRVCTADVLANIVEINTTACV